MAYSVKTGNKYYVYADKEKSEPADEISPLIFSPNGKISTYRAVINGKWHYKVFINGRSYPGSIDSNGNAVYVKGGKIILIED